MSRVSLRERRELRMDLKAESGKNSVKCLDLRASKAPFDRGLVDGTVDERRLLFGGLGGLWDLGACHGRSLSLLEFSFQIGYRKIALQIIRVRRLALDLAKPIDGCALLFVQD